MAALNSTLPPRAVNVAEPLYRTIAATNYPLPSPTGLTLQAIHARAARAAEVFDVGNPDDDSSLSIGRLVEVITRLGGRIKRHTFYDLSEEEIRIGSIEIHRQGDFVIRLLEEADQGNIDARQTLAHELAHYLLHFPLSKSRTLRANHSEIRANEAAMRAEVEANNFADGFLIPTLHFRRLCDELSSKKLSEIETIAELARRFGVSQMAVKNRIKTVDRAQQN